MPLTKREASVISAFTGILLGNFGDMQEYAEEVLDRPIWTHQFADEKVWEELKEAARADFLKICADVQDDGGLPMHLPMGVTEDGQGPTEPDPPHHFECWCGQGNCMWDKALIFNLTKVHRPKAKNVKLKGLRDGETFDIHRDYERLNKQMLAVWKVMRDGKWRTPQTMEYLIGSPWASISARLRDFRKPQFGGLEVEKEHIANGIWMYRLVVSHEQ